jgi:hypothetical protein
MESFIFSGIFWGLVVILFGVSIILNAVFNIHIPFFRVILAILFIYIGIMVLTGGFKFNGKIDKNNVVFGDGTMQYGGDNPNKEFNVVFGRGTTRISDVQLTNGNIQVRISVVFGEGVVEIDTSLPMIIHTSAAFAEAVMPDKAIQAFGNSDWQSSSYTKDGKHLDIQASVVFGELRFVEIGKKKK